ncbi:chemotaxis protein CheB [Streptomyces sp. Je 1-369]|uniref:chemotaxis protein CheB n=1 Tax=Streptomyces sp. Je 1-369 TaxID=2966192 RepID=UPI0022860BB0|nr:chemotaxis protein CheB [Streptomyces sp. Je 1-369]WAL93695.1 chemotaxis protein CheB [Streptomyces sp. Je 1-369]
MFAAAQSPSTAFDVVCMTASLGGVSAYREILSALPDSFPAALVLVQHRPVREHDTLVKVLQYRSALPVRLLHDADRLTPGVVHVVPAGRTAAFSPEGTVTLHPADNHFAADPTFASAAAAFGPRLLVAVLTGRQHDGALGVRHVRGAGGRALAQDIATSEASGMPSAAMATGCIDFVLPLPVLAHALVSLVMVTGAAGMMRVSLPPWAAVIPPALVT